MTAPDLLARFTPAERWVHRSIAGLMGIVVMTAGILYIGPLSILFGRRHLVENIHIFVGIALPLPIIVGWLSKEFRRDVGIANRFSNYDWKWLATKTRRNGEIPVGKFNAGQKLNAAFVWGSILVMLMTGLVMRFGNSLELAWRTGATFVHDWLAYAVVAVIAGHLMFASKDAEARRGMRTGFVSRQWARREHGAWEAKHQHSNPNESNVEL